MMDSVHRPTLACIGGSQAELNIGDRMRVVRCLNVTQLHALITSERIAGIVYSCAEPTVPADEVARLIATHLFETPILVRTSVGPRSLRDLLTLVRAGLNVRASLVEFGDFAFDAMRLVQTATIRSATADLISAVVPVLPPRCREYGTAALLFGTKQSTVGQLRLVFDASERKFRMRFEEIGVPAHRIVGLSLACHGLRLLESGACNLTQIAKLLGFEDPASYSSKVQRVTGYRPRTLGSKTTSDDMIAGLRDEILLRRGGNHR